MYLSAMESPLGRLILTANDTALTGLWFADQINAPNCPNGIFRPEHPVFEQAFDWLNAYFSRSPLPPLPPLAPQGSDFQQAVWQLLLEIPYGSTTTYGTIADRLRTNGLGASAQAVGGAVGHNPILILIPCHRVIGSNGSLTGYVAGLEIKRRLLALECNGITHYIY